VLVLVSGGYLSSKLALFSPTLVNMDKLVGQTLRGAPHRAGVANVLAI
jgi:hypothetical protein